MRDPDTRGEQAAAYRQLPERVYPLTAPMNTPPLSAQQLQRLWADACLGASGDTEGHGHLRVTDFGIPAQRENTAAIARAEIECGGQRRRGDVVIHLTAEQWETEGCGASPVYENTILHVVLQRPAAAWFTRTSEHRDVPVWVVPPDRLRAICGCSALYPFEAAEAAPLRHLSAVQASTLLRHAAAQRAEQRRRMAEAKAAVIGREQMLFEAWAEVLGYAANKLPMQQLARRAPLRRLREGDAEAILLGIAGFLQPVLPERTTEEARAYHRRLWSHWWAIREAFQRPDEAAPAWDLRGVRPMNHPNRRVAALALSALHWEELHPLMNTACTDRLGKALRALSHPFWDRHCTLASAPLRRACALVGQSRAADFAANVIYPTDERPSAWRQYLSLRTEDVPRRMERLAATLFGEREDLLPLLRFRYVQQGLLQLGADFVNREGLTPAALMPAITNA